MAGWWTKCSFALGIAGVAFGCQSDAREPEKAAYRVGLGVTALDNRCRRIQGSNSRYLDAYLDSEGAVVTRLSQTDGTQRWCFTLLGQEGDFPYFTIQHQSFSGKFLDAYEGTNDHGAMLRPDEGDSSQEWLVGNAGAGPEGNEAGAGPFDQRLIQRSSGRHLDAYTTSKNDHRAVTRELQTDGTQRWDLPPQ